MGPSMQEFWLKMKTLLVLARQAINQRLSGLELTSAAGDIIFNLKEELAGLSQEELRERLNIGKAAISRTVDTLVQKGYARRAAHPQDARLRLVSLTRKGREISGRVAEAYQAVFLLIKQDIPEEDFRRVGLMLERIQSNLSGGGKPA